MYIHVHAVMYLYVHGINMYVPCSDTYVPFCPILSRWVGFQMMACHGQSSTAKCWPHIRCCSHRDACHLKLPSLHSPWRILKPLCLLNSCGIVGVELPARNQGMRGTLPTMWGCLNWVYSIKLVCVVTLWSTGATWRHGNGPDSYSLSTSVSSIGPWMGKFSSSNVLKKTRLNKRSSGPILYYGFFGGCPPVGRRWHWKKSWGRAYQQSLKGTLSISSVML